MERIAWPVRRLTSHWRTAVCS